MRPASASVKVRIAGPANFALERSYRARRASRRRRFSRAARCKPIAKGESLTLSSDLFADLVPGTGAVALSVGPSTALDVATLLKALDRYPFGCSEQITSRALPLLYVNELAAEAQLALDAGVDQRIRDAIERLLARQGSNGSFGLWSVGGDDAWLDAYVTDFLTRARERGFAVPDTAFKLALDRLRNFVGNAPEPGKDGGARPRLCALRAGAQRRRRRSATCATSPTPSSPTSATPIAKAQIAAALAHAGRPRARRARLCRRGRRRSRRRRRSSIGRADYGSTLRDAAALVTLASEGGAPRPVITAARAAASKRRAQRGRPTPRRRRTPGWCSPRARSPRKRGVSLDVAGEPRQGPLYRSLAAERIAGGPVDGSPTPARRPVQAVVSVSGAPITPEPAAENGFKIERLYYTLDGERADRDQGEAEPALRRGAEDHRAAAAVRPRPASPTICRPASRSTIRASSRRARPARCLDRGCGRAGHSEFRDDRFSAAFERNKESPAVFTVAYVVRAVSPGRYVLPQAYRRGHVPPRPLRPHRAPARSRCRPPGSKMRNSACVREQRARRSISPSPLEGEGGTAEGRPGEPVLVSETFTRLVRGARSSPLAGEVGEALGQSRGELASRAALRGASDLSAASGLRRRSRCLRP